MNPAPRSFKHTYSVLAIARRHPKLFNMLVKAAEQAKEKENV